jgi:hypothetical protein
LERFNLKKLDDVVVEEKYQVEILNKSAALQTLDESFDINNAWESIRGYVKTSAEDTLGYQKPMLNKLWFDDEYSRGKLQNLRRETSRTFRKNKIEYLNGKINDYETNNKTKLLEIFREA